MGVFSPEESPSPGEGGRVFVIRCEETVEAEECSSSEATHAASTCAHVRGTFDSTTQPSGQRCLETEHGPAVQPRVPGTSHRSWHVWDRPPPPHTHTPLSLSLLPPSPSLSLSLSFFFPLSLQPLSLSLSLSAHVYYQ